MKISLTYIMWLLLGFIIASGVPFASAQIIEQITITGAKQATSVFTFLASGLSTILYKLK